MLFTLWGVRLNIYQVDILFLVLSFERIWNDMSVVSIKITGDIQALFNRRKGFVSTRLRSLTWAYWFYGAIAGSFAKQDWHWKPRKFSRGQTVRVSSYRRRYVGRNSRWGGKGEAISSWQNFTTHMQTIAVLHEILYDTEHTPPRMLHSLRVFHTSLYQRRALKVLQIKTDHPLDDWQNHQPTLDKWPLAIIDRFTYLPCSAKYRDTTILGSF